LREGPFELYFRIHCAKYSISAAEFKPLPNQTPRGSCG